MWESIVTYQSFQLHQSCDACVHQEESLAYHDTLSTFTDLNKSQTDIISREIVKTARLAWLLLTAGSAHLKISLILH